MVEFREAEEKDIEKIVQIYDDIHSAEENGLFEIGWVRYIYPVKATAEAALSRGDLFVLEDNGKICGSAVINKIQAPEYRFGNWRFDVPDDCVTVLHTLVISPKEAGKGYGKQFVAFYERFAESNNAPFLRIDTNEKNHRARAMYKKLGYTEVGIVKCQFNGIKDIGLVLLEKCL